MQLLLQQDIADDYVIATGITHSVAEHCDAAFSIVGLDYREHVDFGACGDRRRETVEVLTDWSLARDGFQWWSKIEFFDQVRAMVEAERSRV